jgi:hypothetical protein
MIDIPKGWLRDRGKSDSERRAKPQVCVVNELARYLYVEREERER